ncbi:MAG: spermidine/putrescine ABC transporter substrate-binding protein [Alphaproteobacteria bacterium]
MSLSSLSSSGSSLSRSLSRPFSRRGFLGGAGALGLALGGLPGLARAADGKVVFYNWATYIDEETIPEFESLSGIEVVEDFFADNDELFNKLRTGNPGFDVIVPSSTTLVRMAQAGIVQPLDHSAIPNKSNIAARFLDEEFDPGRVYSLPYMWGTVGIGYRKSAVEGEITSWGDIYESDKYSGRIAILGTAEDMIPTVMKYLGLGVNETDADAIARCGDVLRRAKRHIKTIAEDNGQDLLAAGEVDITVEYNGDIAQVMLEDDDIGFVVPREGTLIWQDVLAIPSGAPNVGAAHRFINTLLDSEVGARIADYIQYATPNEAALALTSAEYRENEAIFPPDSVLRVSETSNYLGEEYEENISRAWDEFLAS